MNHSSRDLSHRDASLLISKSIDGFQKFKTAEGLSVITIVSYGHILKNWLAYAGDRPMADITTTDLTKSMAWLRTEYKPICFNGSVAPLSAKSIRNVWGAFRSFFTWFHQEFKLPSPAEAVTPPDFRNIRSRPSP